MQGHVLVTEDSWKTQSRSWEWHKLDKDNHFEVCRPNSKNHAGYRILLDLLQRHMNDSCGVTSSAMDVLDSDVTSVLGKRQGDDLFEASETFPWNAAFPGMGKRFSFKEEGSSGSGIFSITPTVTENPRPAIVAAPSAPTIKPSTPPDIESDTPSDQSRFVSFFDLSYVSCTYSLMLLLSFGRNDSFEAYVIDHEVWCAEITSYISLYTEILKKYGTIILMSLEPRFIQMGS